MEKFLQVLVTVALRVARQPVGEAVGAAVGPAVRAMLATANLTLTAAEREVLRDYIAVFAAGRVVATEALGNMTASEVRKLAGGIATALPLVVLGVLEDYKLTADQGHVSELLAAAIDSLEL